MKLNATPLHRRLVTGLLLVLLVPALGYALYWRSPEYQLQRGMRAWRAHDLKTLESAADYLKGNERYQAQHDLFRGILLLKTGKPRESIAEFEKCEAHPDLRADTLTLIGEALFILGRSGNAKLAWEQALTVDPSTVDAHRWLGVLYHDIGAMQNAIEHLKQVSNLAPTDPRPDRLIGSIYGDYEHPNLAILHLRESLRRDPHQKDAEEVRLELAEAEVKQREFENAIATLRDCPPSAQRNAIEANCHLNLGNHELAVQLLDEAFQLDPTNLEAILLKHQMLLADGDLEGALACLERGVKAHPFDYNARSRLVLTLRRMKLEDRAIQEEQVAEQLQANWSKFSDLQVTAIQEPTNANLRLEIGQLAEAVGRPDLAEYWYAAALSIDPGLTAATDAIKKLLAAEKANSPPTKNTAATSDTRG